MTKTRHYSFNSRGVMGSQNSIKNVFLPNKIKLNSRKVQCNDFVSFTRQTHQSPIKETSTKKKLNPSLKMFQNCTFKRTFLVRRILKFSTSKQNSKSWNLFFSFVRRFPQFFNRKINKCYREEREKIITLLPIAKFTSISACENSNFTRIKLKK